MKDQAAGRRWSRVAVPLGLFAIAFAVRALPSQGVLVEGRTLFFGNDAYYHMRRILYSVVRFPASLDFDPYINFPDGGQPIWTPFFDWFVAASLRPLWGPLNWEQLERIAIWVPPLLGALTVVALYDLARRFFGRSAALLAGVILSVLPGHFWYSQVGFIDHHAAVALATTLLLGAAMALMAQLAREPTGVRPGRPTAAGVSVAAVLLLWPGSLLHVGLVEIAFLAALLGSARREAAIAFASRLVLVHAVAFGLLLPFGSTSSWEFWGRFSPVVLSAFQPWYMAAAALFCLICGWSWRVDALGASRRRRALVAVAVAGVLLGLSVACFPELLAAAGDAWEWFAKRDSFQGQVAESAPLFLSGDEFTFVFAFQRLSIFVLAVPIALVVGTVAVRAESGRAPVLLFLWWSFGLFVATVFQRRFFNSASVAIALLMALSICWVHGNLRRRFVHSATARSTVTAAVALVSLFLLLPVFPSYLSYLQNQLGALRGEEPSLAPHSHRQAGVVEMANWLRAETPVPSGWLAPKRRPAYGILGPWTIGHVLEYEARRPTVTDNFGDDIGRKNYLLARRYFQSREAAAVELLQRLNVRYVIAQAAPNYLGEEPIPGSMFFSLYHHDGSSFEATTDDARHPAEPALERHRLVYEARALARTDPPSPPLFKVFEFVEGARVVGAAAPGAKILATLPVRTNRGRRFVYTAKVTASDAGDYVLRLPYANRDGPAAVRVGGHYTLRCGEEQARVTLEWAEVATGAQLRGPRLCGGGESTDPKAAEDELR